MAPMIITSTTDTAMGDYICLVIVGAFVGTSIVLFLFLCACCGGDNDRTSRRHPADALKDAQDAWKTRSPKANLVPKRQGNSPQDQKSQRTSDRSMSGKSVVDLGPLPTVLEFKVGKKGKVAAADSPQTLQEPRVHKTIASLRPSAPVVKSMKPDPGAKSVKPDAAGTMRPDAVTAKSVKEQSTPENAEDKSASKAANGPSKREPSAASAMAKTAMAQTAKSVKE